MPSCPELTHSRVTISSYFRGNCGRVGCGTAPAELSAFRWPLASERGDGEVSLAFLSTWQTHQELRHLSVVPSLCPLVRVSYFPVAYPLRCSHTNFTFAYVLCDSANRCFRKHIDGVPSYFCPCFGKHGGSASTRRRNADGGFDGNCGQGTKQKRVVLGKAPGDLPRGPVLWGRCSLRMGGGGVQGRKRKVCGRAAGKEL